MEHTTVPEGIYITAAAAALLALCASSAWLGTRSPGVRSPRATLCLCISLLACVIAVFGQAADSRRSYDLAMMQGCASIGMTLARGWDDATCQAGNGRKAMNPAFTAARLGR